MELELRIMPVLSALSLYVWSGSVDQVDNGKEK
jgi:hypothetical protein